MIIILMAQRNNPTRLLCGLEIIFIREQAVKGSSGSRGWELGLGREKRKNGGKAIRFYMTAKVAIYCDADSLD